MYKIPAFKFYKNCICTFNIYRQFSLLIISQKLIKFQKTETNLDGQKYWSKFINKFIQKQKNQQTETISIIT